MPDDEQPDDEQSDNELPADLAAPARRALTGAGITRLDDLAALTENEVMQFHGMGPKALQSLRRALAAKDLAFTKGRGGRRLDKESLSRTRR